MGRNVPPPFLQTLNRDGIGGLFRSVECHERTDHGVPRLIDFFIEFSHDKLMSKIQPVVTRKKNSIQKERTYDVLSIQR